eukprot:s306_g26.t2
MSCLRPHLLNLSRRWWDVAGRCWSDLGEAIKETPPSLMLKLLEKHPPANIRHLNMAMASCGGAQLWQEAVYLLTFAEQQGLRPDVVSYSTAMGAASKHWQIAVGLFQAMADGRLFADVVGYSALMSICEKNSQWPTALGLFGQMSSVAITPNVVTFKTAISACEKADHWQSALHFFQAMPKAKVSPNVLSYNSTISACEKHWQIACHLFATMSRTSITPNLISFSALISSYGKNSQWPMALDVFKSMGSVSLKPNAYIYSATISACERGSQWPLALHLCITTKSASASFNAASSGMTNASLWQKALQLFNAMPKIKVTPDTYSYNAAINACEKGGNYPLAQHLLKSMAGDEVTPTIVSYNTTISACEKSAKWSSALGFFYAMSAKKLKPNVISFNSTLSALEKGAQWVTAFQLFHSMPKAEVVPNVITHCAVISACEKSGQWQWALHMFHSIPQQHLSPDLHVYNSMLAAFDRSSLWSRATELFSEMASAKVQPDSYSYNSIISACRNQWQLALYFFSQMGAVNLTQDDVCYNSLLNGLADVEGSSIGMAYFQLALANQVYPKMFAKAIDILDVHDCSPGAARLALSWWLANVVAKIVEEHGGRRFLVITGWGKSRAAWKRGNLQQDLLKDLMSLDAKVYEEVGCIKIQLTKGHLAKLREKAKIGCYSRPQVLLYPAKAGAGQEAVLEAVQKDFEHRMERYRDEVQYLRQKCDEKERRCEQLMAEKGALSVWSTADGSQSEAVTMQECACEAFGPTASAPFRYAQVRSLNKACGLVGYPNVGKSSLFNAFVGSTVAAAENFPFCTIEPNVVKVGVPDVRLHRLAELCASERTVPGQLEIRDIAGLIKGASAGAGMGNAFLSQIRGVQVVFHVVRCFSDQRIVHVEDPVNIDPVKEPGNSAGVYESILEELIIADLEYASKRLPALRKKATTSPEVAKQLPTYEALLKCLEDGKAARHALPKDEEVPANDDFLTQLITAKPVVVLANVAAEDAASGNDFTARLAERIASEATAQTRFMVVSAQLEAEVAALDDEDFRVEYLESYGLDTKGPRALTRVLEESQGLLRLVSYLTVGEQEARAWFVPRGSKAHEAAGAIHSDFTKNFEQAEIWSYDDLLRHGSKAACRKAGAVKMKGKDYEVQDGDVIEFRIRNARS